MVLEVPTGEVEGLGSQQARHARCLAAVCATLVIGGLVVSAHADNAISRALHDRKVTVRKLEILHDFRRVGRQNLHHQIRNIQARIHKVRAIGPALASDRQRFNQNAKHLAKLRRSLRQRLHKLERNVRHRTLVLRSRRMDLSTGSRPTGSSATARSAGRSTSRTTSATRFRIARECRPTSIRATT
jgi:chromosome segregation ATPase